MVGDGGEEVRPWIDVNVSDNHRRKKMTTVDDGSH